MVSGKVAMEQLPFTWFAIYRQICTGISRTTLSKQDWAAYSGTTYETVFRMLQEMVTADCEDGGKGDDDFKPPGIGGFNHPAVKKWKYSMSRLNKPLLSLVGAGPGDAELITLKAVKVLGTADVVLYDALANEEVLIHAPAKALKLYVGKRYGCHALSQHEINQRIAEYAFSHGHVVRLKGGDPFVFGRAQEEIEFAQKMGIPVNIVPGISSAIAVPSMQMIPLTSRGVAESFWVTTGTTRSGEISGDIALAAQSTATVIILMAMSKLDKIMEIFSSAGKAETPVAIIQDGTSSKEKMVTGKVSDILFRAQHAGIGNPAIIIIGDVVSINRNRSLDDAKAIVASMLANVTNL